MSEVFPAKEAQAQRFYFMKRKKTERESFPG